jgi:hypothetical protein
MLSFEHNKPSNGAKLPSCNPTRAPGRRRRRRFEEKKPRLNSLGTDKKGRSVRDREKH